RGHILVFSFLGGWLGYWSIAHLPSLLLILYCIEISNQILNFPCFTNLYGNSLTGGVPYSISQMGDLETLPQDAIYNHNQFSGSVSISQIKYSLHKTTLFLNHVMGTL
ncbi:hypothetical protein ACJX0J_033640, partial [Zea mays]